MPNFLGGHLNPVTYGYHREEKGPMETKLIFDCTRPAPPATFPPMCRVPPEVVERVNPADVIVDYAPGASLVNGPDHDAALIGRRTRRGRATGPAVPFSPSGCHEAREDTDD